MAYYRTIPHAPNIVSAVFSEEKLRKDPPADSCLACPGKTTVLLCVCFHPSTQIHHRLVPSSRGKPSSSSSSSICILTEYTDWSSEAWLTGPAKLSPVWVGDFRVLNAQPSLTWVLTVVLVHAKERNFVLYFGT